MTIWKMMARAVLALGLVACGAEEPAPVYDLVIQNGRVIDPETKLDAVRNIGVLDGSIAAISDGVLAGDVMVDAAGFVVAPGFIDIHSHSPTPLGTSYQVRDGVTTILDLEAGAFPVSAFGALLAAGSPVHFGNSVSHLAARIEVIEGNPQPYLIGPDGPLEAGAAFVQQATAQQIEEIRERLETGLDRQGGIGIGVLLDYVSVAVSDAELGMVFEVAGERNAPVTVHVRRGLAGDPAGLIEVIELAEKTGAPVLICHITHSAMHAVPDWLERIDAANAAGARITTETLSFAAGGTSIGAAVFGRDWRSIFNIDYGDVQWTATGEWLTEETFNHYRETEPFGMVNHHYVKEDWIETALGWPGMMVVSDVTPAISQDVLANPNLSGTFARLLGHYSRERGVMPLSDALARISLLQAQWLEDYAPVFARKGRLQVGMDADIAIFDPQTVGEIATYGDPYKASAGINTVIVGGKIVVRDAVLLPDALPGNTLSSGRQ